MTDPPVSVLIADDNGCVREALATLLGTVSEIRVAGVATNGRDALDQAQRLCPDVVLLDLRMPLLDGYAATELLTARDLAAVVVLSIHAGPEARRRARAAGASAVLEKGCEFADMVRTLLAAACARRGRTPVPPLPPPPRPSAGSSDADKS